MNRLSIDVGGRTAFEPGAAIDVEVHWSFDEPPKSMELRLVWNTAGKGTVDVRTADAVGADLPSAEETRTFSLTLPREPYSFSGKLVSLVWALELIAFPSLASTRTEITIGPGGAEVNLLNAAGKMP